MKKHFKSYAILFTIANLAYSQSVQPAFLSSDSLRHNLRWKIEGLEDSEVSSVSIDPVGLSLGDSKATLLNIRCIPSLCWDGTFESIDSVWSVKKSCMFISFLVVSKYSWLGL